MRLRKGIPQVLITVRVSREQAEFVRVATGRHGFATMSEYIRSLIGIAQNQREKDLEFFGIRPNEHNQRE